MITKFNQTQWTKKLYPMVQLPLQLGIRRASSYFIGSKTRMNLLIGMKLSKLANPLICLAMYASRTYFTCFKTPSSRCSLVYTVLLVLSLENIISIRVPNLSYFWLQFKITWLYKAISTLIADTHQVENIRNAWTARCGIFGAFSERPALLHGSLENIRI